HSVHLMVEYDRSRPDPAVISGGRGLRPAAPAAAGAAYCRDWEPIACALLLRLQPHRCKLERLLNTGRSNSRQLNDEASRLTQHRYRAGTRLWRGICARLVS